MRNYDGKSPSKVPYILFEYKEVTVSNTWVT
jgi:hypothetical protein